MKICVFAICNRCNVGYKPNILLLLLFSYKIAIGCHVVVLFILIGTILVPCLNTIFHTILFMITHCTKYRLISVERCNPQHVLDWSDLTKSRDI